MPNGANNLNANSMEMMIQNHRAKLFRFRFRINRTVKNIYIYKIFKLSSSEVICYAAVANYLYPNRFEYLNVEYRCGKNLKLWDGLWNLEVEFEKSVSKSPVCW